MLEMLVVCALIAILVAVAIPTFFGENLRARGMSEVQPMFNDLRTRMVEYAGENSAFPASIGEGTLHPATPVSTAQPLLPLPATWTAIKVRITNNSSVYCGYTWVTGLASNSANIGVEASAFGFTAPDTNWYYLLAKCDLDGDSSIDSFYFTSSVDPTILKRNEGH